MIETSNNFDFCCQFYKEVKNKLDERYETKKKEPIHKRLKRSSSFLERIMESISKYMEIIDKIREEKYGLEKYESLENQISFSGHHQYSVIVKKLRLKPLKDAIDPEKLRKETYEKLKGCDLDRLYEEVKKIEDQDEKLAWAGLIVKAYLDFLAEKIGENALNKYCVSRRVKVELEGNEGMKKEHYAIIKTHYNEIKYGLDEAFKNIISAREVV